MTGRDGEGISLQILSALQPLVPLNVTGPLFCPWGPLTSIYLSAPSPPPLFLPLGISCPEIEATSAGVMAGGVLSDKAEENG